jgi:hypothetical protein
MIGKQGKKKNKVSNPDNDIEANTEVNKLTLTTAIHILQQK